MVKPRNDLMLVTIYGWKQCTMTLILPRFGFVPSLLTTWPINVMLFATKQHLLGLSFKLTSLSLPKIACKCVRCSSQFLWCMLRSSTNIFKNLSPRSYTSYIVLMKVLVVSFSPKGINVHSYNPFLAINIFKCHAYLPKSWLQV